MLRTRQVTPKVNTPASAAFGVGFFYYLFVGKFFYSFGGFEMEEAIDIEEAIHDAEVAYFELFEKDFEGPEEE